MPKEESLVERYERLSKELKRKTDKQFNETLNERFKQDLDAMETAMKNGDSEKAFLYDMLLGRVLRAPQKEPNQGDSVTR